MESDISLTDTYTAASYLRLPEGFPYHLIHGKLVHWPSRTSFHQMVLGNLAMEVIGHNRRRKQGRVIMGPLDVVLDEANVFQPDLLFIREERRAILDGYARAAPDFVVEVLDANATAYYDRNDKKDKYGQHGVREYWIIDPEAVRLEIYRNHDGKLLPEQTITSGEVQSQVIEGLAFDLEELWEE